MVRIIYPQSADYRCQHCDIKDGTILESKRSGRPYIVYLHAAHQHQDIENSTPQLIALCPRCHMKHDREQANGNRRSGYGKLISTENLTHAVRQSGLLMWVDGLHWQCNHLHCVATGPLEAVVQALTFLQTTPAAYTEHNQ